MNTVIFGLFQGFQKIYKQFFPQGDPSDFAGYVFKVFDENAVWWRGNFFEDFDKIIFFENLRTAPLSSTSSSEHCPSRAGGIWTRSCSGHSDCTIWTATDLSRGRKWVNKSIKIISFKALIWG